MDEIKDILGNIQMTVEVIGNEVRWVFVGVGRVESKTFSSPQEARRQGDALAQSYRELIARSASGRGGKIVTLHEDGTADVIIDNLDVTWERVSNPYKVSLYVGAVVGVDHDATKRPRIINVYPQLHELGSW